MPPEIGAAKFAELPDNLNADPERTLFERRHLPQAGPLAEQHRLPVRDQFKVADLKPLRHLSFYRTAAPGAGPGRDVTVESLRAGRKPKAVVPSGRAVVFGANLIAAALRELGPVAGDATRGGRRETTGVRS